jgi:hypothetical protein
VKNWPIRLARSPILRPWQRVTVSISAARQQPPAKQCNGRTLRTSPPSRNRMAPLCRLAASPHSSITTSSATSRRARSPKLRRRNSSINWSSNCASSDSSAPRNTMPSSRAIPPGSPNRSGELAPMVDHSSQGPAFDFCRRSTTWVLLPNQISPFFGPPCFLRTSKILQQSIARHFFDSI